MIKRLLVAVAAFALTAALALAATVPVKVKVTAIDGKKVTVELVGEKADWMKKNAPVKFKGGVGRIKEIVENKITLNSRKADVLKVGDEIELDKGPATLEGC
jgi:opacity protein-like surface antigen